jgi:hypothetical protein
MKISKFLWSVLVVFATVALIAPQQVEAIVVDGRINGQIAFTGSGTIIESNGINSNGINSNGINSNGINSNGINSNGINSNGIDSNEIFPARAIVRDQRNR